MGLSEPQLVLSAVGAACQDPTLLHVLILLARCRSVLLPSKLNALPLDFVCPWQDLSRLQPAPFLGISRSEDEVMDARPSGELSGSLEATFDCHRHHRRWSGIDPRRRLAGLSTQPCKTGSPQQPGFTTTIQETGGPARQSRASFQVVGVQHTGGFTQADTKAYS